MKILAIGAHPDDIEIGCGGTLLYLKQTYQAELHMLLMTQGEAIHSPKVKREQEQAVACQILGIHKCFCAHASDTTINLRFAIQFIEKIIDQVHPDYIFTHYEQDTHQDHRVLSQATTSACRNRLNLLYYESLSSENFQPTLLVDISETLQKKCEAVRAHKSQEKRLQLVNYVKMLATFRAHRTGCQAIEGFIPKKFLFPLGGCDVFAP